MRGLIVMYEDITARMAARAGAARGARAPGEDLPGVALWDRHVLVPHVRARQPGHGAHVRLRAGELAGLTSQALHDTREDFERAGEDIYARLRSGQPMYLGENWLKRKDGSHFWVRVTLVALDRDDPIRSVLGSTRTSPSARPPSRRCTRRTRQQQAIFGRQPRRSRSSGMEWSWTATAGWKSCSAASAASSCAPGGHARSRRNKGDLVADRPGKTYRGEQKLTRLDGSELWCRISGRAIDPAKSQRAGRSGCSTT
jgi:hypothetical protein